MTYKDDPPRAFVFFVKGFALWKGGRAIHAKVGKALLPKFV